MCEDFGTWGDEFLLGDCQDDWQTYAPQGDEDEEGDESYVPEEDCPLDGDAESALASCGWGTDEDYGCFGGGEDDW
jgi:hypothetical protein